MFPPPRLNRNPGRSMTPFSWKLTLSKTTKPSEFSFEGKEWSTNDFRVTQPSALSLSSYYTTEKSSFAVLLVPTWEPSTALGGVSLLPFSFGLPLLPCSVKSRSPSVLPNNNCGLPVLSVWEEPSWCVSSWVLFVTSGEPVSCLPWFFALPVFLRHWREPLTVRRDFPFSDCSLELREGPLSCT